MTAIVTDSTIYIPKAEAQALGLHIVPISYSIRGTTYCESYNDQNGDFENLIFQNADHCTTSQASISEFKSVFEKLLSQNYEVLCIVMSSRLSGTHSSASIAARELNSHKIVVVDSLTTAGGLYLLTKKAKELLGSGYTLHETAEMLNKIKNNIKIIFSVDSMAPLRRSGRLGIVKQSVGAVLNIRPLLMLQNGAVVSCGTTRGKTEQLRALVSKVPENAKEIVILHLGKTQTDIAPLFSELKKSRPEALISQNRLGPVLGIHLGLGVIGIAWIG